LAFVPKAAIKSMNREKGRKGGIATAQKHSKEWLSHRAQSAGKITRDLYGADFYSYINSKRKVRKGWPKGKLRKGTQVVQQHIEQYKLSQPHQIVVTKLLEASK